MDLEISAEDAGSRKNDAKRKEKMCTPIHLLSIHPSLLSFFRSLFSGKSRFDLCSFQHKVAIAFGREERER